MVTISGDEVKALCSSIIRYRGKHNLTQSEFAELCGVSRATIVTIESGKVREGRSGITALTWSKIQEAINN